MTFFNDWYWSNLTVQELRKTLFNTELLDTERFRAKQELIRRTTKYSIDDLQ
jgi:hypothetical protein